MTIITNLFQAYCLNNLGTGFILKVKPVEKSEVINSGYVSMVWDVDTANVLESDLGKEVVPNQYSFSRMDKGDVIYFPMLARKLADGNIIHTVLIAPQGAKTVPEEYEIQYFKATFE